MIVEFDARDINGVSGSAANGSELSAETIASYLSAGILFPDEVRQAERMLHHLNNPT